MRNCSVCYLYLYCFHRSKLEKASADSLFRSIHWVGALTSPRFMVSELKQLFGYWIYNIIFIPLSIKIMQSK